MQGVPSLQYLLAGTIIRDRLGGVSEGKEKEEIRFGRGRGAWRREKMRWRRVRRWKEEKGK